MALLWDREAAARTGLTAEYLSGALLPRLDHQAPDLDLELDGQRTLLRITLAGAERLDIDDLLRMPLPGPSGPVPLAGALRSEVQRQPPTIERIDQRYRRYFRVFYRGPFKMGKETVEKAIDDLTVPVGYRLELPHRAFFTDEIQNELTYMLLGALGAVLLVMAIVSESWSLPLVTIFAVPMSFVGVALGFVATKAPVAEGAFLGFALLAGLAVNHGILLMDRYARLRRARPHGGARQLGRLALRQRLSPMWATTIASIAGLVPILFAQDSSDLWRSLAITVGAGLLSSAILMPAAFLAMVTLFDAGRRPPGE
jgi:multidrug efflux pump subunit AcrB